MTERHQPRGDLVERPDDGREEPEHRHRNVLAAAGCSALPLDERGEIVERHVRRSADLDDLVDDVVAAEDPDGEGRHIVHGDVVGDGRPVAEDERPAFLPDTVGNHVIDPHVHERGRPQHHVGHAASPYCVFDVPLEPEDIDGLVRAQAAKRDVGEPPHACIPRGGAQVLVCREIDPARTRRARAHVVVGGRNDLVDALAGRVELRHVEHVHGGDFGAGALEIGQLVLAAGERPDGHAGGDQLAGNRTAQLAACAGDEDPALRHRRIIRPGPGILSAAVSRQRRSCSRTAEQWTRDLRHAARALRRAPGFTVMAVGTLGPGHRRQRRDVQRREHRAAEPAAVSAMPTGSCTSPAPRQARICRPSSASRASSSCSTRSSRRCSRTSAFYFGSRPRCAPATASNASGCRRRRARCSRRSAPGRSSAGFRSPADEDRVAVISHALWQSWFGGDPNVLGRTFFMAGSDRTVVGVMDPEFRFPSPNTLVWISSHVRPEGLTPGQFGVPLVARMAPGATPEAVANELTALARRLPERFGGSANYARIIAQHRAIVRPLDEAAARRRRRVRSGCCFAASAIVLLIACANVANLFMVRAEGRQRDLAVRRAIGADARAADSRADGRGDRRRRAGGRCSRSCIAALTLPAFLRAAPAGIPRLGDVAHHRMDDPVHARRRDLRGAGVRRRAGAPRVRRPSSRVSATAAAARRAGATGDATDWSPVRPRSRSCC